MNPGRIIVIAGLPGAGNTTTARRLAQRLPRAAHVEADEMQRLIVSGGVWPEARDMSAEAHTQLRLRLHHACLLSRSFADAGIDAVVDDIIIGSRVDDLLDELSVAPFHLVMLAPAFATIVDRWKAMASPYVDAWSWMDDELHHRTRRVGLWLDTTDRTPDQVVDDIVERLDDALVSP